jgi:hypothetical protein
LKDRFRHLKPLQGVVAVLTVMALVLGAASFAFAFDSGGSPSGPGADSITWTGQGAINGVLNTTECDGSNTPYLLWVLTTDGGSAHDAALHLSGTGSGDYAADVPSGNTFKFTTPYFTPDSNLHATADFTVDTTGGGAWNLVISHGCPGSTTADSTVSTTVHDADHHAVNSVSLGTQVHDSVDLTTNPTPVTLPDGSSITVNFFDGDCTAPVADTTGAQSVSGQSSPVNLEDQLPKTVGVGQHAYQASFTSGDTNVVKSSTGPCEPFEVTKGTSTTTTEVHDANHTDMTNGQVALGAVVHDTATVTGVPSFPINSDGTGTVTFTLYNSSDCLSNLISTEPNVPLGNPADPGNGATKSSDTAPLAAGHYGYQATYNGDSNYNPSTGLCEPFEVTKNDTTTTTQVHDAAHHDITNGGVAIGSYVHDKATVSGNPAAPGFAVDGTVTFRLYNSSDCLSNLVSEQKDVPIGSDPTDGTRSTATQITTPGNYGYQATYGGNDNYNGSTGACEPFSVFQPGKTMGFWGNTNGIARINAAGGYAANAVAIGRGSNIDTQAESLKVLPLTLNACGKGSPFIFTVGAQTASSDCTLAAGINKGSFNTLAAQTLALGYNIKLVGGYDGQSIGQLQCQAYLTAGLTSASKVQDAFNAAVALINNSASGGTTTQSQIGAMNLLLNCLNREA